MSQPLSIELCSCTLSDHDKGIISKIFPFKHITPRISSQDFKYEGDYIKAREILTCTMVHVSTCILLAKI